MTTTKIVVLSVSATVAVFLLVGLGVVLGMNYVGRPAIIPVPTMNSFVPTPAQNTVIATSTATALPVFSGKVTLLNRDLKLLKDDPNLGHNNEAVYYETGTINEGKYKDYKRVMLVSPPMEMGLVSFYTFATKDYNSFVFDGEPKDAVDFPADNYNNPYSFLEKSRVTAIDHLPLSHPEMLELNDSFALLRDDPVTYSSFTVNAKDPTVYDSRTLLVTDFSQHQKLASLNQPFQVYAAKNPEEFPGYPMEWINNSDQDRPSKLGQSADVNVLDSTGMAYNYHLVFKKDALAYLAAKQQYDIEYRNYLLAPVPTFGPAALPVPVLQFNTASLQNVQENLYQKYGQPFAHGLSHFVNNNLVKNIAPEDLTKIAKFRSTDIYKLGNANDLVRYFFQQKIGDVDTEFFKSMNHTEKPTLEEYAATLPLVFIKDPWGRVVVLQESTYEIPLEVGKPVLYFYPPTSTQIRVQLDQPVDFSTTIPTYHKGWQVMASPNGILTDLQPQFTDCAGIDAHHSGSEYAAKACEQNAYPYIYWAGLPVQMSYPAIDHGWVVPQSEVVRFMNEKLDYIGLTAQEKADMLEYWLPRIMAKSAPFYRISFLQNEVMDKLVPMTISPRPDTIARVLLDFVPLQQKMSLPQQHLQKIVRQGFTVVEWGGLKQ